mgnify:FL=1
MDLEVIAIWIAEAPRYVPSSSMVLGFTSWRRRENTEPVDPHPLILLSFIYGLANSGGNAKNGDVPSNTFPRTSDLIESAAIPSLQTVLNFSRSFMLQSWADSDGFSTKEEIKEEEEEEEGECECECEEGEEV